MAKLRGFWGLRGRQERQQKREIKQELRDLRADNLHMSKKEFKKFAIATMQERYDTLDVGLLRELLDLVIEYLPLIFKLFSGGARRSVAAILLVALLPAICNATDFLSTIPGAVAVEPVEMIVEPVEALPPVMAGEADAATDPITETNATPTVNDRTLTVGNGDGVVTRSAGPVRAAAQRLRARQRRVFRGRLFGGSCSGGG